MFRVYGVLGFWVSGDWGFRVWGLGFIGVSGIVSGFKAYCVELQVQARVQRRLCQKFPKASM